MEAQASRLVIHGSVLRVYRRLALPLIVGAIGIACAVLAFGTTARTPAELATLRGFLAYCAWWLFWWTVTLLLSLAIGRREGLYAEPHEVGRVDVRRRHRPLAIPPVRLVRFTSRGPWLAGHGGTSRTVLVLDADGRRLLVISSALYDERDIDRFVERSGLPVQGDWTDVLDRGETLGRYPAAVGRHTRVLVAVAVMAVFWAAGGLIVAIKVAT